MPVIYGYEVLCALIKNRLAFYIPFFFSTAHSQSTDIQKAKALGIENYLVKTFDRFELINFVEKYFLEYNKLLLIQ